jgi:hypothetical protein
MQTALSALSAITLLAGTAAAQAPAKPAGKALTPAELGQMLEVMGYNPTAYKDKDGTVVGYDLEFKSGEWTIRFSAELSKDKSQIWFDGGVASFVDKSPPSAEALLEILAENNALWPASIYYSKKSKKLFLTVATPNKEVTPAGLRTKVEGFAESIKTVITKFNKAMGESDTNTAEARRKFE